MSRFLVLVLFAGLTACTSLDSAFDGASNLLSPSSRSDSSAQDGESAENAESTEISGEARANAAPDGAEAGGAQKQAAATSEAEAAQAAAEPAAQPAAQPAAEPAATSTEAQTETAGQETASAQTGEQSGETEEEVGAGGEAGIDGRRIITVPKGGGANAEIRRRLDSLLGESRGVSSTVETGVKESEIVGVWQLEEEDGLRNCTITLTAPDKGGEVSGGADCTGLAAQVTGWGMFGNDLLLRDADNTVRARLRRSDAGWIGFTLETGIPLVMSRAG